MGQQLTTAFDSRKISSFKRAVAARDVEKVKEALAAGVDPATSLNGGDSPLLQLVFGRFEDNQSAQKICENIETFEDNTTAIIDMLLAAGLKVAEPEKHETAHFEVLADYFYQTSNLHDGATIVIQALYETLSRGETGYLPNLHLQLQSFLQDQKIHGAADLKSLMAYSLNMMESMHETVRARLANPQSETECALVEQFDNSLGYWKGEFPRPSLASLQNTYRMEPTQDGGQALSIGRAPAAAAQPKQQEGEKKKIAGDERFAEMMAPLIQTMEKRDAKDVMAEIEGDFIGLDAVKNSARKLILRQQFDMARQISGQSVTPQNHSTVFLGNPGLGKTTFARKKAELLHSLGLAGPNYVEVSRENIIGGYVGHTEGKMTALFQMADVIFIDETYSLNDGRPDSGDFGKKVIDALVPALENNPNLVVFMAGYPEEMQKLLSTNPGLRSRLTKYENFEDMNREQLGKALDLMLSKEQMTIAADARDYVLDQLDASRAQLGDKNFGNARLVRNIVRNLPDVMAERMFGDSAQTSTIIAVPSAENLGKVTLADAKALNYSSVLGVADAKAAAQAQAQAKRDLPSNHPEWQPKIGFTARI